MANIFTGLLNRLFNPHRQGSQYNNAIADAFLGLDSEGLSQFESAQQFNSAEAEKQRQFEFDMWNRTNDYNSPANQIQLLRQAGLNPSMMYGQPVDTTASVPAGAEANSPSGSAGQLSSLLGLGADISEIPAKIDLMRAQAEEIRSRVPVNQQKVNELINLVADLQASVDQRKASAALMLSQRGLTDEQKNNISFEQSIKQGYLDLDKMKYDLLADKTAAEIKKMNAEEREITARAGVSERELQEMIWTYATRKAGLEKQNNLTDVMIAQANATADKLAKEGVRIDQIVSMDSNREQMRSAIKSAANSSNLLNLLVVLC